MSLSTARDIIEGYESMQGPRRKSFNKTIIFNGGTREPLSNLGYLITVASLAPQRKIDSGIKY